MPETKIYKKINGVFEGGGVKGSALIGAVAYTEKKGFWFENVAGTSAGAIIAALIAAGYKAGEIEDEIQKVDYKKFKDLGLLAAIPLVGIPLNLFIKKGIYEGDFFEKWLRQLLARKNVRTFGDLIIDQYKDSRERKFRLQVVASDVTKGKLLVLPNDAKEYGIKPERLDVARAVRMSMSIPYFYKPVKLYDKNKIKSYIVDGGLLSNFPVWLFDDKKNTIPTVGYKLVDPQEGKPKEIIGPITLFAALFATMMEAHDARYIEDSDFQRTVPIPTLGIQTTNFSISDAEKQALYKAGYKAAEEFFGKVNKSLRKPKH